MGATTFMTRAVGKTAKEAFEEARGDALWEYGHGGYTGTIAEKRSFTVIPKPVGVDPCKYAEQLIENADPRVDDKWGPAGCINLGGDEWLFFGWASS